MKKKTVTAPKKPNKQQLIKNEEAYVEFLKKRLESKNYQSRVSPEELANTKEKYDKAKLKLKVLKS